MSRFKEGPIIQASRKNGDGPAAAVRGTFPVTTRSTNAQTACTMRGLSLLWALLLPVALGAKVGYSDEVSVSALEDPMSGGGACMRGRAGQSAVCDPSALLSRRSVRRVDQEIHRVFEGRKPYAKATCAGRSNGMGYLIEVAVVRRMARGDLQAISFATQLFRRWKVGERSLCGNGVLVFVSIEDRRYAIIPGYNVQRLLSASRKVRIEKVLKRYLRDDNLHLALINTVMKLGSELAAVSRPPASPYVAPLPDSSAPETKRGSPSVWSLMVMILGGLVSIALLFACCNGFGGAEASQRKKLWRATRSKLRTIKTEYETAELPQYLPESCSVCSMTLSTAAHTDAATALNGGLGGERRLRCGHAFQYVVRCPLRERCVY